MGTHCAHKESHSHNTSHENTQHSHYYPMLISSKYKSELSELYNEFHPPEYQFRRVVAPEWVFYAIHTPQYRRKAAKTVLLHRSKAKRIKAVMSWSHWHWVICSKVPSRMLMDQLSYVQTANTMFRWKNITTHSNMLETRENDQTEYLAWISDF